jgi:Holliday junction resolvase RusA-like endonuclease
MVTCTSCRQRATTDRSGLCRRCIRASPLAAVHAAPPPTENPVTLMWLGEPVISFTVYGEPGSQGSKTPGQAKNGRLYVREVSKKVKPWRDDVRDAFLAVRPPGWVPLEGPIILDFVVSVHRPVGEPKTIRTFPGRSPDWDKLKRSTNDALKTAGMWRDDGQLHGYRRSFEVYEGDPDPDALTSPGAVIRAWRTPREALAR